jgi:hypothetical protein
VWLVVLLVVTLVGFVFDLYLFWLLLGLVCVRCSLWLVCCPGCISVWPVFILMILCTILVLKRFTQEIEKIIVNIKWFIYQGIINLHEIFYPGLDLIIVPGFSPQM